MSKVVYLALACVIALSSACITIVQPGGGATPDSSRPSAYIDLISPSSLAWGQEVSFTGHGETSKGSITAYRWRSSIDGDLSSRPAFNTATLSPGKHIILFSVQNDAGSWSLETQGTVNLTTDSTGDGTLPPDDGGTAATPPVISFFNANPTGITAGSSSTLSWSVTNAIAVTIDNGVGSVGLSGTRVVSPATDTAYTLTAANTAYYSQATAKVTVAAAATPRPDLIIEDIWKNGTTLYYRIKNQGTASSPVTSTKLTIDGVVKATDSVPSLAAGSASTQSFSGYSYTCSGASDAISVAADSTGVADESNEGNNSASETFSCLLVGPLTVDPPLTILKSDLTITEISYDAGTVKFTVKNQGVLDTGPFDVKLYVGGVYKDTVTIAGGLVAGGQATFAFPHYHHFCVIGSHATVKVTADTGGTINESDETNNSRSEYWGCPPAP